MTNTYTAYIERDVESGMYIGTVPGLTGAHTCAETIDELHEKLKEVIALCLEEMDADDIKNMPVFTRVYQIEIAL
jgi:predicted RNase H-like HicB family nuclease